MPVRASRAVAIELAYRRPSIIGSGGPPSGRDVSIGGGQSNTARRRTQPPWHVSYPVSWPRTKTGDGFRQGCAVHVVAGGRESAASLLLKTSLPVSGALVSLFTSFASPPV